MDKQKIEMVHQVAREMMPTIYKSAMEESETNGLFQHDDWQIGLALDAYRIAKAFVEVSDAFEEKHLGAEKKNLDVYF